MMMNDYHIDTTKNIQDLIKRLTPGKTVKGRILDKLEEDNYILRIYGYNIITKSKKQLIIGDELDFEIKENNNHLTIKLIEKRSTIKSNGINITI
jgi:hypothetical protein